MWVSTPVRDREPECAMFIRNAILVSFGMAALLATASNLRAQPAGDAEVPALDSEINRLNLSGLTPRDQIVISRLLAGASNRGDWLVRQAGAWMQANPTATAAVVNQIRADYLSGLPAIGTGPFAATRADIDRWQAALNALKAAAKTLMEIVDKAAIIAGNWDPPTQELTSDEWAALWGRGLNVADLARLRSKSPVVALPPATNSILKAIEATETADRLAWNATLSNLDILQKSSLDAQTPAGAAVRVAIALHARALGADDALLARLSVQGMPTTAQAWNDVAGEFERVSAPRLAAMARQLAGFAGGGNAATTKAVGAGGRIRFKPAQPAEGPCAVVDIVRTGPQGYVATLTVGGSAPVNTGPFADAAGLFSEIQRLRNNQPLTGLLIAPDRGCWPDAGWYQYCGAGKPVAWIGVIPSVGLGAQAARWNVDSLMRHYCLHLLEKNGRLPAPAELGSVGSPLPMSQDAEKKFGFEAIFPRNPAIRNNISGWESAMNTIKGSNVRIPFLMCVPSSP